LFHGFVKALNCAGIVLVAKLK